VLGASGQHLLFLLSRDFLLLVVLAFAIALLTVATQSLKTILANPVKSLRSE